MTRDPRPTRGLSEKAPEPQLKAGVFCTRPNVRKRPPMSKRYRDSSSILSFLPLPDQFLHIAEIFRREVIELHTHARLHHSRIRR